MDSYKIEFKAQALKDIKLIPKIYIKNIYKRIKLLEKKPYPTGIKKLFSSENLFRIRTGNYRVIYSVDQNVKIITIYYIRHRKDIYKKLN